VVEARAQIGDIGPGEIFVPFHYGYWDDPDRTRAANELTIYEWDPVSKQPHYKYASVKLEKISTPSGTQPEKVAIGAAGDAAHGVTETLKDLKDSVMEGVKSIKPKRAHIADYIGLLQEAERRLVKGFLQVADNHKEEPDLDTLCRIFAAWSEESATALDPFVQRYGERKEGEPEKLDKALLHKRSPSAFNMLRDLHDLWLMVNESMISLDALEQAARAKHDREFEKAIKSVRTKNKRQRIWLRTRLRQTAPQTLVVPS
jgi:ferredoxin-nitrate reductase